MSDETMSAAGDISWGLQEHFAGRYRHRYAGQVFEPPTDEQWEALGEDPGRMDCPLILFRPSDGKFFEVEIDVTVSETSPEQRAEELARLKELAERYQRRTAREQD